jgi:hypothetical protein
VTACSLSSSCSMSCCIDSIELEDVDYGYVYHDDYNIYFNYLDDASFMHVIAYRFEPNILT